MVKLNIRKTDGTIKGSVVHVSDDDRHSSKSLLSAIIDLDQFQISSEDKSTEDVVIMDFNIEPIEQ